MKKVVTILASIVITFVVCISIYAQVEPAKVINGGVLNGKAINLVKPQIPAEAKATGASGAVNVEVIIDANGNVFSAKAVSGNELLRKNSEEAALSSKFPPTKLQGQSVNVKGTVVYNFINGEFINGEESVSIKEDFVYAGILNKKALSLPDPIYPSEVKALKVEDTVVVEVTINEEGKVISAIGFSENQLLRKEALNAAIRAKFSPFTLEGKRVKVKGILIYKFAVN